MRSAGSRLIADHRFPISASRCQHRKSHGTAGLGNLAQKGSSGLALSTARKSPAAPGGAWTVRHRRLLSCASVRRLASPWIISASDTRASEPSGLEAKMTRARSVLSGGMIAQRISATLAAGGRSGCSTSPENALWGKRRRKLAAIACRAAVGVG